MAPGKTNIRDLVGARVVPFTHFALLANEYMNRYGVKPSRSRGGGEEQSERRAQSVTRSGKRLSRWRK